jgi:soluble lytic murein transglycosylase-like protein
VHFGVSASPSFNPMFPASVRAWEQDIYRWAAAYGIPVDLVAVVMTLESCGDPSARSSAGAQGLFQVMPFHFATGEDPGDPEVNARRGLSYLSRGLQLAGGDMALALAGYNGGHGLIQRDPPTWPSETTRYVRWGTGILGDLQSGASDSPTLRSWLDAGGASLCRRAGERPS